MAVIIPDIGGAFGQGLSQGFQRAWDRQDQQRRDAMLNFQMLLEAHQRGQARMSAVTDFVKDNEKWLPANLKGFKAVEQPWEARERIIGESKDVNVPLPIMTGPMSFAFGDTIKLPGRKATNDERLAAGMRTHEAEELEGLNVAQTKQGIALGEQQRQINAQTLAKLQEELSPIMVRSRSVKALADLTSTISAGMIDKEINALGGIGKLSGRNGEQTVMGLTTKIGDELIQSIGIPLEENQKEVILLQIASNLMERQIQAQQLDINRQAAAARATGQYSAWDRMMDNIKDGMGKLAEQQRVLDAQKAALEEGFAAPFLHMTDEQINRQFPNGAIPPMFQGARDKFKELEAQEADLMRKHLGLQVIWSRVLAGDMSAAEEYTRMIQGEAPPPPPPQGENQQPGSLDPQALAELDSLVQSLPNQAEKAKYLRQLYTDKRIDASVLQRYGVRP